MRPPLVRLAGLMDWGQIERHFANHVTSAVAARPWRRAWPSACWIDLRRWRQCSDFCRSAISCTWQLAAKCCQPRWTALGAKTLGLASQLLPPTHQAALTAVCVNVL